MRLRLRLGLGLLPLLLAVTPGLQAAKSTSSVHDCGGKVSVRLSGPCGRDSTEAVMSVGKGVMTVDACQKQGGTHYYCENIDLCLDLKVISDTMYTNGECFFTQVGRARVA